MDANSHICRDCGRRFSKGHDVACSRGGYEAVSQTWRVANAVCSWVGWAEDLAHHTAAHMATHNVSEAVASTRVA